MITDAELSEWSALCGEATEGPWHSGTLTENRMNPNSPVFDCVSNKHGQVIFRAHRVCEQAEPDAKFIAATRVALPRLIEEVEADVERMATLGDEIVALRKDLNAMAAERDQWKDRAVQHSQEAAILSHQLIDSRAERDTLIDEQADTLNELGKIKAKFASLQSD